MNDKPYSAHIAKRQASKTTSTILIFALGLLILISDSQVPLGVASGLPFVVLVLIGFRSRQSQAVWVGAILGTAFNFVGMFLSPSSGDWVFALINRCLTVLIIWMTAYFCLMELRWAERALKAGELEKAYKRLQEESSYLHLNRDIAFKTNMSKTLEEAIEYSLERICREIDWVLGHFYRMDEKKGHLVPTGIWYCQNPHRYENFIKATEVTTLDPGEGLPGRVLADSTPHWIRDVEQDSNFSRNKLVAELGVKTGLAFPVFIGSRVAGVMEFFSNEILEPNARLLEVMESIGILLGRVMERQQVDRDQEEYNNHLRRLYHRLDSIREEESKRIAREVHDELGQVLTAIKLDMSRLQAKVPPEREDISEDVTLISDLIQNMIQTVKRISLDLRPPVLDHMSLTEAIEWQGKLFQSRTGIQFDLSTEPDMINLDTQRSSTIYRIFQECLTNVIRHSEASKVNVDIMDMQGLLTMNVSDNGKGLVPEQINENFSLGLLGMKERAQIWGGQVHFTGRQNEGTTITIELKH